MSSPIFPLMLKKLSDLAIITIFNPLINNTLKLLQFFKFYNLNGVICLFFLFYFVYQCRLNVASMPYQCCFNATSSRPQVGLRLPYTCLLLAVWFEFSFVKS